jgi:hypothetical protein
MKFKFGEEKEFMSIQNLGVKLFQDLLIYNINKFYDGKQIELAKAINDKIEKDFQRKYNRPSMYARDGRYWISESAISRWLVSKNHSPTITMISYLGQSGVLKFPEWIPSRGGSTVQASDILDILLQRIEISFQPPAFLEEEVDEQ